MNMNETIFVVLGVAAFVVASAVVAKVRHIFIVTEGFAGLLYRNGKFVEILQAGRHVRWGRVVAMTLNDLRKTTVQVAGQEVLTAGNVSVKFSLMLTYQINMYSLHATATKALRLEYDDVPDRIVEVPAPATPGVADFRRAAD